MTVVFFEKKIIFVKTFKTASSSIHFYLANKLLGYNELFKYMLDGEVKTDKYLFTSYMTGHETFNELKPFTEEDLSDYAVIGIVREPLSYIKSVFNQFLHDEVKQAPAVKVTRFLAKISHTFAYLFFYFYYVMLWKNKANILNANYKLLSTYNNLYIINYDELSALERILPEFSLERFKTYNVRKYSDVGVPSCLDKRIKRDFHLDLKLLRRALI